MSSHPSTAARRRVLALGLLVTVLAGGCSVGAGDDGLSSGDDSDAGVTTTLTIGMPNAVEEEDNNPFDGGSAAQKLGYAFAIYEPLAQINVNDPAQEPIPWLASEWSWNEEYTTLTIVPREDVTWSDGEPFTADDVAYSFRIRKENPALNPELLPYDDVTVADDGSVVVTFTSGQFVNQVKPLNAVVVPEHLWSALDTDTLQDDPVLEPVGTGPYVLDDFTLAEVTLSARDDYWGGKLAVPELSYRSFANNEDLTQAYVNGEVQWGWAFIASYEDAYIAADREHYNQFAPTGLGIDALYLNTQEPPFDDVAVRRAVNRVLDREDISVLATSGVWLPLRNATGLPQPAGDPYISSRYANATLTPDLEVAAQILADAGYTLDDDGLLHDPSTGDPVTFTLTDPDGWTDYMWELSLVAQAVKPLGITATVEGQDEAEWTDAIAAGEFQASLHWTEAGATPWDTYSSQMNGSYVRPIGEHANGNFGRFQDDRADKALSRYASTTDEDQRAAALQAIQDVYVSQVPVIPLLGRPNAAQYSTLNYDGFPTAADPYASPQPTSAAASLILTRLTQSDGLP